MKFQQNVRNFTPPSIFFSRYEHIRYPCTLRDYFRFKINRDWLFIVPLCVFIFVSVNTTNKQM